METTEFINKFADTFQTFMQEAQLSSAVSMVIDEAVLADVNTKPSALQIALASLVQELQSLHSQCNPSSTDDVPCQKCGEGKEESKPQVTVDIDPSVIQITADNKEIDKRIQAFIERKQVEKDDTNRREFCARVAQSMETSCARTEAVFSSKMGGKSHVKVSKVVNKYGPQTRPALVSMPVIRPGMKRARSPPPSSAGPTQSVSGVEERLHNMESFLKIKSGTSSSSDVFQRLKTLEDRILYLESVSPEYSHISSSLSQHQRSDVQGKAPGDRTVQDIDNRIKELQRSLRLKKARMETASVAGKTET